MLRPRARLQAARTHRPDRESGTGSTRLQTRRSAASDSGATDRFGYTGREYDATTGLQYNRARYYDAVLGRWTQEDKIGFNGQDPNLYRYVGNGPTNAADPSGLAGYDEGPSMRADDRGDFRRWIDEKRAQTKQILEQTFYGHYYEGETTRAGALGQVAAGLVDVDIPTDVTDLYHDVTHFRNERDYYGTLATDVLGVIPLIGAVKGLKAVKNVGKAASKAAEAADALKPLAKAGEEVLDEAKPLLKNADCATPKAVRPSPNTSLPGRVTGELPPGMGRTPSELSQARNFFERNRDAARNWWEQRTGSQWPDNATHYEHPRPLKNGGDPLFVEPGFHGPISPHMVPGPDGLTDFQRWGGMRGRPYAN